MFLLKILATALLIASAIAADVPTSSIRQSDPTRLADNKETSKRETGYSDTHASSSFIKGGTFGADSNSYGAGASYGSTNYNSGYGNNGYRPSGNSYGSGYGNYGTGDSYDSTSYGGYGNNGYKYSGSSYGAGKGSYGATNYNNGYAGSSYGAGKGYYGTTNYNNGYAGSSYGTGYSSYGSSGNSYGSGYNTYAQRPTYYNRPSYQIPQLRDPKFLKIKFHKQKGGTYPVAPAYNNYQSGYNYGNGNGYGNYGSSYGNVNCNNPSYALQPSYGNFGLNGGAYGVGSLYGDNTYGSAHGYGIAGSGFTGPLGHLGGWYPTYGAYGGRLVNDLIPYTGPPSNGYADALYKRAANN